ncbi:MAG: ATP-dependent zinc metalloprotease FtsH [Candidatus Promineifilaceae bacterium]|nr:ATP-dependent zinc metalloprotease FtsH [Candidatus Promineifilaceae bacterium]
MWIIVIGLLSFWVWNRIQPTTGAQISYSRFRAQVIDDNVSQVTIVGEEIRGELNEPITVTTEGEEGSNEVTEFLTYFPAVGDDALMPLLATHEVEVNTEPSSDFSFLALAINFLPFLLLIGIGYFFLRRAQGQQQGLFSMGRSRAKLYDESKERTTFDDVAGLQGAKTELQEIIEYLRHPEKVERLGGTAPKGILLVGPPGTGKTLLARAVAGEARAPFFSMSGSDFMEMFVGVGASRVRDLFKEARQAAPCIIFIDELDSVGRRRGAGLGGGHDEREQTLNQLLSELDGFEPSENVVVMAATNRPDILDPALLRPGRFDRQITVDLPTVSAREKILRIHARNKPLAEDVDLQRLAQGTPGFSGADLENILNEAALLAARNGHEQIRADDIEEARDKVMMGLVREGLALTKEELRLIAYHEAGHAIVAAKLPHADPIHKVTIVPRGQAMGVTQQLPEKDKYIYQREYLVDRLAVMMGGRAAEQLAFNTTTSGAANDLKQATGLARRMVLSWGMSPRFAHLALGSERQQVFLGEEISQRRQYSEETAREADEEIKSILDQAYDCAAQTLEENRKALDDLAQALLEREEIDGPEVLRIAGVTPPEEAAEDEQSAAEDQQQEPATEATPAD